eukprot:TRINITY_DN9603_c0_g1_i1.p1 TRINITY_DN9603_c0_g1~~TRINITY_DN9603_c0_g1_i1.p1  ORF type:complete len:585 (+),score=161.05 TRINITY_DN9603_c0_g1_i1:60-1814(+)
MKRKRQEIKDTDKAEKRPKSDKRAKLVVNDERFAQSQDEKRFKNQKPVERFKLDNRFRSIFGRKFRELKADPTGKKIKSFQRLANYYKNFAEVGGSVSEESSEDESSSELEEDSFEVGEAPDKGEVIPEGEVTSRLSILHCDWHQVRAVDLLALFQSFLPPTGAVHKITIYPSDYGMRQMEIELQQGPDIFGEDGEVDEKKLRKYESQKLRYYFAIAECNNEETAQTLYKQLDGQEYERTVNRIDLRYVPTDLDFSNRPCHDSATSVPEDYVPPEYTSHTFGHTKQDLTWEADPNRERLIRESFQSEVLRESKFKELIASDSDEEDKKEDLRSKFRSLLDEVKKNQVDLKEDFEVTFATPLGDTTKIIPTRMTDKSALITQKAIKFDPSIEEDLIAEEIINKKLRAKSQKSESDSESDQNEEDVWKNFDEGFDEPEPDARKTFPKKKKNLQSFEESRELTEEEKKKRAELELLIDDEDKETLVKKDVEIDVRDKRFRALFTDPKFSRDPTDPRYDPKLATNEIIAKARDQLKDKEVDRNEGDNNNNKELSSLISAVKSKAMRNFKNRDQRKTASNWRKGSKPSK